MVRDQPIMLIFLPIMVCCSALKMSPIIPNIMLKNKNCWSDYYAICIQICMSNSLHEADNFYKDCFIRVSSTVDGERFAGLQFQRYRNFHGNTIMLPWL